MVRNSDNKLFHFREKDLPKIVFVLSFPIVFIIWFTEFLAAGIAANFHSLIQIHQIPTVWISDLIPFIAAGISYFIINKLNRLRDTFLLENSKLKDLIAKYSGHAYRMGQGDFSNPVSPVDDSDQLGNSLYFLQGYLKANNRKENNLKWITEGKDIISRILRINNRIDELSFEVLKSLTSYLDLVQGAFYIYEEDKKVLRCTAVFAYNRRKFVNQEFRLGHGLVGQCAYEMDYVYRTEIPDDYITISSGIIGDEKPRSIILVPLIADEKLQGILEFASVNPKIPKLSIQFLLELGEIIGRTLTNLRISQKTELLLEESRKMTEELRQNERTLHENAGIMEATQQELKKSNEQLEAKIREVENMQGRMSWLLENASEIISIYNNNLQLSYISPSVRKILGYSPEEMMEGKDVERMTREGSDDLKNMIKSVIANPEITPSVQYNYITREGIRISLESSARNALNDAAINGIIVNTRDITERTRAEKEERLKTRMQSLSENSLDLILRLSTSGQFFYVNPVFEDYTGISSDKLFNKSLSEVEFTHSLQEYLDENLHQQKLRPEKTNKELAIPVKMGEKLTERILSIDSIPEFNSGELETILFVGHDITEAKRIGKEIQEKNKNIEDSINYAEKIQTALLPAIDKIRSFLPKSFVYYKPRDIVSGDFPWFYTTGEYIFIAVVDCTGHGVPGALLSFIAFFLMKDVIDKHSDKDAAKICDILHENFRETLRQNSGNGDARDGFDIALCKIKKDYSQLDFAGAHRPLYLLSRGELTEYKGDRKAIGGIPLFKKTEADFTNSNINIKKGDKIFIYSDGMTDQLGGPYGRKYTPQRLRDNLLKYPGNTMQQYNEMFRNEFDTWQKGFKQLDDVLVIGIEF